MRAARLSTTGEDLADVVLGVARHHREHFVAGLEDRVTARHDDVLAAHDRDDRRVARDVEIADRLVEGRGRDFSFLTRPRNAPISRFQQR